jgi:hypothetical protein
MPTIRGEPVVPPTTPLPARGPAGSRGPGPRRAMPLVRTDASIVAGSAPDAATALTSIPSEPSSTLTNVEWQINTQLRLGTALASQLPQPTACTVPARLQAPADCPSGDQGARQCAVRLRAGDRLPQSKPGRARSHRDVEWTIIHYFNTYTSITATMAKPFPGGKQADILLSGITTIDNPAARNWHLDVTSTNPMGVTTS